VFGTLPTVRGLPVTDDLDSEGARTGSPKKAKKLP